MLGSVRRLIDANDQIMKIDSCHLNQLGDRTNEALNWEPKGNYNCLLSHSGGTIRIIMIFGPYGDQFAPSPSVLEFFETAQRRRLAMAGCQQIYKKDVNLLGEEVGGEI
jgi:hypothetical protein